MTQPSRSNSLAASSKQQSSPESSQMVNAYAENLMDELFDDVDRILEGDPTVHAAVNAEPSVTSAWPQEPVSFNADTVTVPAMIVPTRSLASAAPGAYASEEPDAEPTPPKQSRIRRLLPKLAIAVACFSGLVALGFWLARTQSQQPLSSPPVSSESTAPTISQDAAFGEYLKRSLNMIDGQQVAQSSSTAPTGTASAPPSAENPVADNRSRTPNVIERVFVPVFQPSQPVATRPMLPTLPAPNQSPASANSNNQAAAPQPSANNRPPSATAATIPNISPTNTHMLVGVLELGDRSAALFEINGVPQRVYVGERIGASGWSVVSVADQEVVVRRNGEVRSIYIGQQF